MDNSNSNSINNNNSSSNKNYLLPPQTSAFAIFDMLVRGQLISQAICIVAKLKLADYLKYGPKGIYKLAEESKTRHRTQYERYRDDNQ